MLLVGLTGAIGSGKTTFAEFLAAQTDKSGHWESWELIAEVATALLKKPVPQPDDLPAINAWLKDLPEIMAEITRVTVLPEQVHLTLDKLAEYPERYLKLLEFLEASQKNPDLQQKTLTVETKEQFRSILQWLGGFFTTVVDDQLWYREIIRRINQQPDLELATIGGVRFPSDALCIKNSFGHVLRIERPSIEARDKNDLTERDRNAITADSTIYNNQSLDSLGGLAKKVWADLHQSNLKQSYEH